MVLQQVLKMVMVGLFKVFLFFLSRRVVEGCIFSVERKEVVHCVGSVYLGPGCSYVLSFLAYRFMYTRVLSCFCLAVRCTRIYIEYT